MKPFQRIVAEHGPAVLRVCRAVLDPADAEDAWAETFLAALKAYPGLPPGSDVRAWLLTIAHRKAIDAARARARRPAPVERLPERPATEPEVPAWRRDLRAALARLSSRQRQAVLYHHVAGLSYREVAAATGGSADAARRAAADGMARLREIFARDTEREGGRDDGK